MARKSKAAVLVGPRRIQIEEFPIPEIGANDGLLRVEACGVCGADWPPYQGSPPPWSYLPLILGHEVVGRIERIGAEASQRWGVKEGDRVVLEEPLPCGSCDWCLAGRYQGCRAPRYGSKSVEIPPGLWGGYSEFLYLDPRALIHKMSSEVPLELAPLYIPLSNGIAWVQEEGGAGVGSTVAIQGPGQHGLGCVIGAREAGAACIIVLGLSKDADRLAAAREMGAHYTIRVDVEDAVQRVGEITAGKMADTVVNATANAPAALGLALEVAGGRATIVTIGGAHAPAEGFLSDRIWEKELTIKGVRGRYGRAIKSAIRIIESGKYPLERLSTHTFSVDETERALKTVGGEGAANAIHVSVING